MKSIGAFDAKTHLSRILIEVSQGEHYLITKHGTPIAELRPVSKSDEFDWAQYRTYFRNLRERIKKEKPITQAEITKWRNEGRK